MNKTSILTVIVVAALVISLCFTAVMYYNESQKNIELTQHKDDNTLYWDLLEKIVVDNQNQTLSQPIPMEDALAIAFERTGWTADTLMELNATRVDVKLVYGYTTSDTAVIENAVMTPALDYSPVNRDGVTYRYMWQIVAYNTASDLMPLTHDGYCLVDAATGEILPTPQNGV
ncbi:hypothetical protein GX563_12050 [Candidatus Bathyarchaeota archaeon]|nr:hypothetical protein [Candidatus Bathyarchaeota archaeon]